MPGPKNILLTVISTLTHTLVVAFNKNDIYEKPVPPDMSLEEGLEGLRGQEAYTNLTIDEIIFKSMHKELRSAGILYRGDFVQAEMDMILPLRTFRQLYGVSARLQGAGRKKRRSLQDPTIRWPNAEVPYYIEPGHFDDYDMFWLNRSMSEWERYTCVRFIPAQKQHINFVRFKAGDGCYSHVGMLGGEQVVSMERQNCRKKAIYLHLLGHVLGLVHEHQTPKSERFLMVNLDNVLPAWKKWLRKYTKGSLNKFRIRYDPVSIMHFGSKLYSKDGESTTVRLRNAKRPITLGKVWRHELSFSDVKWINLLYKCDSKCTKSIVCLNGGVVTESCDCLCTDGTGDCKEDKQLERKTGSNCANTLGQDWSCSVWARQGECVRNPDWMKANCQKACNMCKNNKPKADWSFRSVGLALTAWNYEWKTPDNAKEKCWLWSSRGDCITNPDWMKFNCRRTCGQCTGKDETKLTCINEHLDYGQCDSWAVDGECQINEIWMDNNCRQSCGRCSHDDPAGFPKRENVYDLEKIQCIDGAGVNKCYGWVQRGECYDNEQWMTNNCRKSCQRCDDGRCKNLYADEDCEKWKVELDECVKRPSWMRKFCSLTCGHCKPNTWEATPAPYKKENKQIHTFGAGGQEYGFVDTGRCRDIYGESYCERWAAAGQCRINEGFMSVHCRKSCGICAEIREFNEQGDCLDLFDACTIWAGAGYCTINPALMMTSCRKSCNSCIGSCVDNHSLCEMWKRNGYCTSTPAPMHIHCQKSCGVC